MAYDLLDDLMSRVTALPPAEQAEFVRRTNRDTASLKIVPNVGPQTMAYLSTADIIGYGGAGGSGKTHLSLAKAINPNQHQRSIIFRRESTQTDGMIASAKDVVGADARYNGSDLEFTWPDQRNLKFAGLPQIDDWRKHAGRERDLMVFDEAAEFLEVQVSSLLAWNRGPEDQHCQVILPSNPPRSADGAWYKIWFAPWLDIGFKNPAKPGEIRWAIYRRGETIWVDGPDPILIDGELVYPKSRTFIPGRLEDNPYRDTLEYRASLQALPDVLSRQMLYGDFDAGAVDDAWQTIPTQWVKDAMRRWKPNHPVGVPMCAIGADIAQGGADQTVLAPRHDGWFAPLIVAKGEDTPDGKSAAGMVVKHRRDGAHVVVDLGGGWGGDCLAHLIANSIEAKGYMGVKTTSQRTEDRTLKITNTRSLAYWRFREALDPSQPDGSPIMLPDDVLLLQELCAPTYAVTTHGIAVEAKDKVCARIGRSPDRADAVVMSWLHGRHAPHEDSQAMLKRLPGASKQQQRHAAARSRYG